MTSTKPSGATSSQLKADIDAGRTGDKVAAGDPGLAPLGTDDEAAGMPASQARMDLAREQELGIGQAAKAETAHTRGERAWFVPTMLGLLLLIAIAAVVVGLVR